MDAPNNLARREQCLSMDCLSALSVGKLSDETADAAEAHLEGCQECAAALGHLTDLSDSFATELRRQVGLSAAVHGQSNLGPITGRSTVPTSKPPAAPASREVERRVDDNLTLPRELGQYTLEVEIGRGAMGCVYRARHRKLNKLFAIKVLPPERAHDARAVARFYQEVQATGLVSHPNIVLGTDAGEDHGLHFLVMALVDGIDLDRLLLKTGPLPVADACELIRQASNGLHHAHAHGLVHRDIKPSNLILASDGHVKVLDLGLAILTKQEPYASLEEIPALRDQDASAVQDLTPPGEVLGTVNYMAPEQASGIHAPDIRADVYSLGCTLFKLLTGVAPFQDASARGSEGRTIHTLFAHLRAPIPSALARRPEIATELDELISRLLAKDPQDRPSDPRAVALALQPFCVGCNLPNLLHRVQAWPAVEWSTANTSFSSSLLGPVPNPIADSGGSVAHTVRFATAGAILATMVLGYGWIRGWPGLAPDALDLPRSGRHSASPGIISQASGMPAATSYREETLDSFDTMRKPCGGSGESGFEIKVELARASWQVGSAGLYFGWNRDRPADGACARCQLIDIAAAGANRHGLQVRRRLLIVDLAASGSLLSHTVAEAHVACDTTLAQTLELSLGSDGIPKVHLNGTELVELSTIDVNAACVGFDHRGEFGLHSDRSRTTFRILHQLAGRELHERLDYYSGL